MIISTSIQSQSFPNPADQLQKGHKNLQHGLTGQKMPTIFSFGTNGQSIPD
jgi:hypothetical protein